MTRLFVGYIAERFPPAVFAPTIALHVLLALWAVGAELTAAHLVPAAGLASLLLLQFRLWDDLEDRWRDRVTHPKRVLVRASPVPFRRALAAIGLGALVSFAVAPSATAAAGLALLDVAFVAAYRLRSRLSDHVWRFRVLLLKYPIFVGLIAVATGTPRTFHLALAMGLMYAAASAYEVYHNRHQTIGAIP